MAMLLTSDISYWADMLTVSLCKLLYSVKGCSHAQVHPAGIRRVVSVHIANKDSDHTENTNSYWIKFKLPLAEAVSKPFGFSITSLTLWNWSWAVRLSWCRRCRFRFTSTANNKQFIIRASNSTKDGCSHRNVTCRLVKSHFEDLRWAFSLLPSRHFESRCDEWGARLVSHWVHPGSSSFQTFRRAQIYRMNLMFYIMTSNYVFPVYNTNTSKWYPMDSLRFFF